MLLFCWGCVFFRCIVSLWFKELRGLDLHRSGAFLGLKL
uniref:Uncharacterized protein n=1 Tax=Manihot esculenta TaxID=3983 RepID=A0A2C9VGZ2_MANES